MRMNPSKLSALALCCALAPPAPAQAPDELRNGFDDPFFRLSAEVPDCPVPLGPFITEAERRVQAHHRAERGTTCWLAGQCEQPNAYAYDHGIAQALQAAARERPALFAGTSLWVTVQGRVVYIEGCAADPGVAAALEAFARAVPGVQQALALLRIGAGAPPYKLRPGR
jgi:hypothetical protein